MTVDLKEVESGGIVPSSLVGRVEVLSLTGCSEDVLNDGLDLGWIVPAKSTAAQMLFSSSHIYRLRKLMRICKDFDIPVTAGVIIVDLLQRVDELEERVKAMSAGHPPADEP